MNEDIELYNQFLKGNKDAFNQLAEKYHIVLTKFIMNYVKNVDDAEDLAQDVFVYVFFNKKEYDFKYSFKTYLYTIARSRAINFLSRRKKNTKIDDCLEIFDIDDLIERKLEIKEKEEIVVKAIHKLKPEYQRVIFLYYFEDFKYKEISKVLNISMSKTKVLINRAKVKLKKELKEVV